MKCPKPALCGLCCFWLLVLYEIVMCASHVIGEKMLAQNMAQANKELKAGIEVRMLTIPTDARYVRRPERFRRCSSTGTPLTAFLTAPGKRCIYFHTQFETPPPLNPNPSDNATGHIVAPKKMACGCDESFHLA
ncbi:MULTISPECIES: hypothetical protein [Pseudomonas syringae group]|nr:MULTISPECIES: hypothetical protein [Pseudomonas syringae group]